MGEYFDKVTDANSLYISYVMSKRGSSWKESVQKYRMHFLRNILHTQKELRDHTYQQKPFFEFTLNERGKTRHVRSMHIYDRVVQRSVCDFALVPALGPKLIYDNGASVKGKGISFTRGRLHAHLEKYIRRYGPDGYILVLDFSKFFDNIPHEPLLRMVDDILKDDEMSMLVRHLVDTFKVDISYLSPEDAKTAIYRVYDSVLDEQVPPEWKTGRRFMRKSLGIGSQISQIFGVFFPHVIDNFCKNFMQMKYYGRYMDDLYVIHHDKERLKALLGGISAIAQSYGLHINRRKTQITPIKRGFTFMQVKYHVERSGHVVRRVKPDRFTRERRKLKSYRRLMDRQKMKAKDICNAYMSWRGNMRQFKCRRSIRNMDSIYARHFMDI